MLKLKSVNFEQQQFQTYQLDGQQEWLIGRNATCDLVLPSLEVSRVHGQIVYRDNAYHFLDIGSTSGSLLNGEMIPANEERRLHSGDLIQIGETFVYVEELTPLAPHASIPTSVSSASFRLPEQQWTEGDLLCRCCRVIDETPDVKTFCFVADPPILFNYQPGQFVNLEVEIDGKSVIRPYSISSSPTRPYYLSVTVKRVPCPTGSSDIPPGLVSNWLHDHLRVGDRVKLLGNPLGHFTCLPNLPSKLLLISAGSGITPMMSMSRWVQDTLAGCDVVFLHSARTPQDIVFRAELEAMAAQMPNFRLAVTVTKSALGHAWMGLTGRISPAMLNLVAPDLLDRSVFVCGPEEFMQGVKSLLEGMNFPMQHYQQESFGGKKPAAKSARVSPVSPAVLQSESLPTANSNGNSNGNGNSHNNGNGNGNGKASAVKTSAPSTESAVPMVNFSKSGRNVSVDPNSSILELAEQEGVPIRYSCRVGACGACKVLTRQGQVRYEVPPQALSPKDQEAGYVLACVAYADGNRLVVEA